VAPCLLRHAASTTPASTPSWSATRRPSWRKRKKMRLRARTTVSQTAHSRQEHRSLLIAAPALPPACRTQAPCPAPAARTGRWHRKGIVGRLLRARTEWTERPLTLAHLPPGCPARQLALPLLRLARRVQARRTVGWPRASRCRRRRRRARSATTASWTRRASARARGASPGATGPPTRARRVRWASLSQARHLPTF